MTKKLLHKTLWSYIVFSAIILGISAPSFYFFTQRLYLNETDETLELHQKEFVKNVLPSLTIPEIENWNKYNRNVKIGPDKKLTETKIFSTFYYDTLDDENEPYRELNAPVSIEGRPFTYSSRINLIETHDLIESIFTLFLVVLFVLLIGLFFITRILSRKLWRPFNQTLHQIENFEIDKLTIPQFAPTTIDEFQRLNQSIQKLIDKNILIYKSQREFVENAAHELQTPLAVFQAKLDILSQSGNLNPQQGETIMELNNGISRLNRLNKNLLLLSKIENQGYDQKQDLDLEQILRHLLDFFVEQAMGRNIKINTQFETAFPVRSNSALVEILLSNLLLNAIKHNHEGGQVNITLQEHSLIISNSGVSKALPAEKLFTRFSKSDPSEQGNGLGLAIVRKIVSINNWNIDYRFEHDMHIFSIHF